MITIQTSFVPEGGKGILKNDAFAGSMPIKAAYIVFHNSRQCNFFTGNY